MKTEPASGTTVNGVKADSLRGNLLSTIAGPWGETFFVSTDTHTNDTLNSNMFSFFIGSWCDQDHKVAL